MIKGVAGMWTENKVDSTGFAKVLHKTGRGREDSRCGTSINKDEPSESIWGSSEELRSKEEEVLRRPLTQ